MRRRGFSLVEILVVVAIIGLMLGGAVYGLMGLGLVIIYRATDVVNFALAGLATVGLYAALAVNERGLPLLLAAVAAVTKLVGLFIGSALRPTHPSQKRKIPCRAVSVSTWALTVARRLEMF